MVWGYEGMGGTRQGYYWSMKVQGQGYEGTRIYEYEGTRVSTLKYEKGTRV